MPAEEKNIINKLTITAQQIVSKIFPTTKFINNIDSWNEIKFILSDSEKLRTSRIMALKKFSKKKFENKLHKVIQYLDAQFFY